MLLSGFTIIRNAEIMGYPIVQSITSVLPIVDEFVVGLGQCDDSTRYLLEKIRSSKLKIFDSHWDTTQTKGGLILSEKTNEALNQCQGEWCLYLQGDEVIHEQDHEHILNACQNFRGDDQVEGLLFKYLHFYGSYGVVATARNWYRHEVRIVKKRTGIQSFSDAQGFRVQDRKPRVVDSGAAVYHYGWVKPPRQMGEKNKHMFRWWHGNRYDNSFNDFRFKSSYGLKKFTGTHPKVMASLVESQSWEFNPRFSFQEWSLKDVKNLISDAMEKLTGMRIGEHKNYQLLHRRSDI